MVDFSRRVSLNYDCLRSIAFELNTGIPFREAVRDLNILSTSEELYDVYLYFEDGQRLYRFNYRTNLYDYLQNPALMNTVVLENPRGIDVARMKYRKQDIRYDERKEKLTLPASLFTLDFSGYDSDEAGPYTEMKPVFAAFEKVPAGNIHYSL